MSVAVYLTEKWLSEKIRDTKLNPGEYALFHTIANSQDAEDK